MGKRRQMSVNNRKILAESENKGDEKHNIKTAKRGTQEAKPEEKYTRFC